MKKVLLATVAVLIVGLPLAGQTTEMSSSTPDFDALLTRIMNDHNLPGAGAAIVTRSGVVWARGFGFESIEKGRAANLGSIFDLMSVSKVFTAAAILTLIEDGKIAIDDAINPHLPFPVVNPRHPDTTITFRMLLNHTSSIADDYQTIGALYGDGDPVMSLEAFLRDYLTPAGTLFKESNFLPTAPGEAYSYSNVAFALIGFLVELISEQPFPDYSETRLFKPLGMTGAGWFLSDIDREHLAVRYRTDSEHPGDLVAGTPGSWPGYPDGQLRATLLEVGAFIRMILSGGVLDGRRVLKPETVELMFAPQGLDNVQINARTLLPKHDLALPWQLVDLGGRNMAMHTGRGVGMASCVLIDLEAGFGTILWISGSLESRDDFVALLKCLHHKGTQIAG